MKIGICEKLMWAAMRKTVLDFLSEARPGMDAKDFERRFRKRHREICVEVDDIGPLRKNPLRLCLAGGIVWLAAYEACGDMDAAMFARMIERCVRAPLFQRAFAAQNPFDRKRQAKRTAQARLANEISDSEFNWNTEYRPGRDAAEYFCTYRRCGLCALGRRLGHPELIPHMCQMDYISIECMGGALHRTQPLASGGECCDFHVVKRGSKWEEGR